MSEHANLIRPIHGGSGQMVNDCAGLMGTQVVGDEEATVMSGDDEDVKAPKVASRPYQPTKAEREAHEITHLPYRNWCPHCVAGKGVSSPHFKSDGEEPIGIEVSMDYCFMGDEATEGVPPILIAWDGGHRALWALPVDHKGADDYVVNWLVKKIEEAGYGGVPITIKTDQEPAIMALKRAVAIRRQAVTTPIESPVRESKSNGAVERAVRTWQSQFRTLRHQLEANLDAKLEMSHPLVEWLVIWAADLLSRYVVRENGRTAYESVTGHRCKSPVFMFSETIMFRLAPDKSARNKADSDWHVGVFIGIDSRSTEYIVQNQTGIYKCRTARRLSRDKAFSADTLTTAAWGISDYVNKGAKTSADARQGEHLEAGIQSDKAFAPRRVRLAPDDFKKYGYTQGCRGCAWIEDGIGARVAHNEKCRDRMEKLLEEDEAGKHRIDRAKDRIDHWTADQRPEDAVEEEKLEDLDIELTSQQDHHEQAIETPPARGASTGNGMDSEILGESSIGIQYDIDIDEEDDVVARLFSGDFDSDLGEPMDDGGNGDTSAGSMPTQPQPRRTVPRPRRTVKPITPEPDISEMSGDKSSRVEPKPTKQRRVTGGDNMDDSWNFQPEPDASDHVPLVADPEETVTYGSDQFSNNASMDVISSVDRKILSMAILGVDVTEIYSPARVTQVCSKFGLQPGSAMDLMTGYDFDLLDDRNRAMRKLLVEKPNLLIGSPPCTYMSVLQELNKWLNRNSQEWLDKFELNRQKAVRHIEFCCRLYKLQMAAGRYFLHEHPWTARSWELEAMKSLLSDPRVKRAKTHMCQFGMTSRRGGVGSEQGPVKKPTGFASNSFEILQGLAKECSDKDHQHVPLMGGRAAAAAIYPTGLCDAICRGLRRQLAYDKLNMVNLGPVGSVRLKSRIIDMLSDATAMRAEDSGDIGATSELDHIGSSGLPTTADEEGWESQFQHANRAGPGPKPTAVQSDDRCGVMDQTHSCVSRGAEDQTLSHVNEIGKKPDLVKPAGNWPGNWGDSVHEEDGGSDEIGMQLRGANDVQCGRQEGREMLRNMVAKLSQKDGTITAWDDVSNENLVPQLVMDARQVELDFFKSMHVYDKVPRQQQKDTGGKLIGTRWVDTNKGDMSKTDYRSRLVAQEFATHKDDSLYAATPPLEALRMVISHAATMKKGDAPKQILIADVRRAYFYALAKRNLFIELPAEDKIEGEGDLVGKLRLNLYGTRDGATNWQNHLTRHMQSIGFVRGVGHASVFWHPEKMIMCLVHGDDYVCSGGPSELSWLKDKLSAAYDLKTQLLGPGARAEGKVLNRVVRWDDKGWEIEADPRHAELIIEQLGIRGSGGITTAGAQQEEQASEDNTAALEGNDVTLFRGLAARCNYLALDRPDLQYAAKEVCREMSSPTLQSLAKLRRVGQYLYGKPRLVWAFEYQQPPTSIDVYVDANWAACRRTRKSTSGGCAMLGRHCIKTWAKTQATIAKSSAESELYGIIRGSTEGLGLIALGADFGMLLQVQVHVDASAAIGIVERQGLQKIRHIEVDILWLQEMEARRMMPVIKIKGDLNPADLMTKNVPIEKVMTFTRVLMLRFESGRAKSAAQLHVFDGGTRVGRMGYDGGTHTAGCVQLGGRVGNSYTGTHTGERQTGTTEDEWTAKGEQRIWIRSHHAWRRCLFTPYKVLDGPGDGVRFKATRVTTGITLDGRRFQVTDCWHDPQFAHRDLGCDWIGTTAFEVKYSGGHPVEQTKHLIQVMNCMLMQAPASRGLCSLTRKTKSLNDIDDFNFRNANSKVYESEYKDEEKENFLLNKNWTAAAPLEADKADTQTSSTEVGLGVEMTFDKDSDADFEYSAAGTGVPKGPGIGTTLRAESQGEIPHLQLRDERRHFALELRPRRAQYAEEGIRDREGGDEVPGDKPQEALGVMLSGCTGAAPAPVFTSHLPAGGEGEYKSRWLRAQLSTVGGSGVASRALLAWHGQTQTALPAALLAQGSILEVLYRILGALIKQCATPSPTSDLAW